MKLNVSLEEMNRKTVPVSSSTIRRRTRVDVGKRLEQIRDEDDYLNLTDMDTETGLNDRHENDNDSVGLLEDCLGCANDTSGIAAGAVFHEEEGGMEFESDYTEGLLASGSDSSEPEDEIYEMSLSDKIADWARHFGISLVALTALLGILRLSHSELPKDGRTLLRTTTKYSIQEKAGGKYYYFGIIHSLSSTLSGYAHTLTDGLTLRLQINIDGLPLFKSSKCSAVAHPGSPPQCPYERACSDRIILWRKKTFISKRIPRRLHQRIS